MARGKASPKSVTVRYAEAKPKRQKKTVSPAPAREVDDTLERVLARVSAEPPAPAPASAPAPAPAKVAAAPALRTARVVTAAGRAAEIVLRGDRTPIVAAVGEEVESEVVARAAASRDAVLVEIVPDAPPVIVGVLQTHMPRSLSLKGTTIEIEAEREILLKTGRGALRIREDGDIELVGSRILAMSRGLFRIVGKMLRLN